MSSVKIRNRRIYYRQKNRGVIVNRAQMINQFQDVVLSLRRGLTGTTVNGKIFFLHIPKCGGTSVDAAITEAFGWKSCYHLDSAASRKASEAQNADLMKYRNSLLPYFMEQNGLRYISGHFVFDADLHNRYGSQWHHVTLLRNPVQKYISQYFYNLQKQQRDHFGIKEELESFIHSEEGIRLGQDMVQKLTGSAKLTTPGSPEQESQIELAIRNIEKFRLVGILEDLQRFQQDFEEKFGASLRIKKMNRNSGKNGQQISSSIRNKIEELCQPDMAVYEHVKKMLYR